MREEEDGEINFLKFTNLSIGLGLGLQKNEFEISMQLSSPIVSLVVNMLY